MGGPRTADMFNDDDLCRICEDGTGPACDACVRDARREALEIEEEYHARQVALGVDDEESNAREVRRIMGAAANG